MLGKKLTAFLALALAASGAKRVETGLSQSGAKIGAMIADAPANVPTVLLIGGLAGKDASSEQAQRELQAFEKTRAERRPYRLVIVPVANPDGSRLVFPPTGAAYTTNAESHVLWRWIGQLAPDYVVVVGSDEAGLGRAVSNNPVAGVGKIPTVPSRKSLPKKLLRSEASVELAKRRARTSRQLATELAVVYGHNFDQLTYIPGMAVIAQMRLGNMSEVQRLTEPYLSGSKPALNRPTSTTLAGHLVFAELAERTGDARARELVRKAADLGFDDNGAPKESMPLHDEMSDSFFMGTPIVTKAGKLTGERKYFDMAVRHEAFMEKLDLRPDGLYRHSPLDEAAWGRGNGFGALGLALTLTDLPVDHPGYAHILLAFQQHMAALAKHQDDNGMWHQVVDHPESYAETSATTMISLAMLRGINKGWIDPAYRARVDRAWKAVLSRIASDGTIQDVCESTGKQKSLEDYFHRVALFEKDPRGGGMALQLALEMAGL